MPFLKVISFCSLLFFLSCKNNSELKLFELTDPDDTGLQFSNDVPYTEEFNTYTYRNFYNGGGVAIGDINNDGLSDIYFTGSIADNKLFLNKGNWKFEDITKTAGVSCSGVWSTGVSMVDINGDGLLDIYVCKAGKPGGTNRHNELFINQGNLTFKESAKEFGLDIEGLSIHAAFLDYDRDGDLDCYVLNNSLRSVGSFDLIAGQRNTPSPEGNKFLVNENGKFRDATQEVGMYSSNIGFGLGITVSDFNNDQFPDLFISNDFFERDYLYINQQDGTFFEMGDQAMPSMSMGSMGADACDLDNDLMPDIFVTEMLPRSLERKKTKTQYETWDKYISSVDKGYHHQYARNALHKNIGNGKFLELGRYAGVSDTEWSWASLAQDYDNDGWKDLFVSNGLYKDLLDKDYLNYSANTTMIKSKIDNKEKVITMLVDSMPSQPVKNAVFKNEKNLKFKYVSDEWGFEIPTFSNGSAYGDLDNDGDLDIVVNNVNMPSFIYKNNTDTATHRSIGIQLKGKGKNTKAIGAKVIAKTKQGSFMMENYTSRGFQSTIDSRMHIGLGGAQLVDTLSIFWPDGTFSLHTNLKTNTTYTFDQSENTVTLPTKSIIQESLCTETAIAFKHREIDLNLFGRERLLVEMQGFTGPAIAVGDVNKDGIDDVFCGGGKNQASKLYVSTQNGKYQEISTPFDMDYRSESVHALFVDTDNDNDLDLYVAHGGKTFSSVSPELDDVLYINDGKANFIKAGLQFSESISTANVAAADLNGDKLIDFVVAEAMKTDMYGLHGSIYIMTNLGKNQFKTEIIPASKDLGMLTDVKLLDINGDRSLDIITCGKWMPLTYFLSNKGDFRSSKPIAIPKSVGLWNVLTTIDLDEDGDLDVIAGNEGENSFLKSGMTMFVSDFDDNGSNDPIICDISDKKHFPIHDLDELFSQLPVLKKKFKTYRDFASVSLEQMFDEVRIQKARKYTLDETKSIVLLNNKKEFQISYLPSEVQYSCIHSIFAHYVNGNVQMYLGGNFYKIKPQFGRQDGSSGWKLGWKGKFINNNYTISPLFVQGQIRKIMPFSDKIIFGINNEAVKICTLK
jgi:hypothetical protein